MNIAIDLTSCGIIIETFLKILFMKIKLPLFLAVLFLAQVSFAQFSIGVKAGLNLTKIDGKSFRDEFKTGYHLGGFMNLPIGGGLGIQPEVLFNQYQTRTTDNLSSAVQPALDGNSDIKLNYLSIPLLLTYRLGGLISLQAGPQFGVLIDKSKNTVQNGQDAFKKGDFSMLGGVQLNLLKLKLTGRYFVGLNNINDLPNQENWKNQGWQLSVGLGL